jgi:hypothetical protein
MNKKILISCPIQNRAWILPYYLEHIKNLNYPKHLISFYFIINNCTDNSHSILKDFVKQNQDYKSIKIDVLNNSNLPRNFDNRTENTRHNLTYQWLSELRNKMLDECINSDCDYLISIDSDILVNPEAVNKLISQNLDICAGLIYNGYYQSPQEPHKFPNILKRSNHGYAHFCNYYVKNPLEAPENKLVEIDFTGAIIAISKNVCANTKIRYFSADQGEDESFSKTAQQQGYKLFCSLDNYNQHIMGQSFLQKFINNELTMKNIYNLS